MAYYHTGFKKIMRTALRQTDARPANTEKMEWHGSGLRRRESPANEAGRLGENKRIAARERNGPTEGNFRKPYNDQS